LLSTRQTLAMALSKYLKYLEAAKSVSPHTSKSYATDLNQFYATWGLSLALRGDLRGNDCKEYIVRAEPEALRQPWNEEDLLDLLQTALPKWQHLKASSRNRKLSCIKAHLRWLFE